MIKEWFPALKKTVSVVGHLPGVGGSNADTYGATRLGLDLVEYRKRQVTIAKHVKACHDRGWRADTVLFPASYDDWVKFGAVTIVGIARTPSEYGHAEWNDEHPRILRARLNDKQASFIDCSLDFLSDTQPKPPVKEEVTC